MLIPPRTLDLLFGVHPSGILHIGAHEAEEYELYIDSNWLEKGSVTWVEAQPQLANKLVLRNLPKTEMVICAAAWHEHEPNLKFNVASNSQSSSVFDFGTHKETYPEIFVQETISIAGVRLYAIITKANFNFIALDIQGAELNALIGLGSLLENVIWVYTECNKVEVYKDAATLDKVDTFLKVRGFKRVATRWVPRAGWGDCLYVNYRVISWNAKIRTNVASSLFQINEIAINIVKVVKKLLRILLGLTLK
jgi:FkbM family methyltransferase